MSFRQGRLWKGPIGDLTIDVNFGRPSLDSLDLLSVQPAGYHTQGNHILWHFTDYEPQQDIEIESMYAGFWKSVLPLKNAAERTGAEADWYRYAMALLPGNIVGKYPGDMMESVAALIFTRVCPRPSDQRLCGLRPADTHHCAEPLYARKYRCTCPHGGIRRSILIL